MTSEFKVIDPKAYWAERAADAAVFIKDVTVTARLATAGEEIVTQMKDGHVETTNTANDGDVIIRNPSGEEYIIGGAKFAQRYAGAERLSATYGDFKAAGQPTPCVRLTEDVEFTAPWGTPMQIKKGGVLVFGGENDIYGIQKDEFHETYARAFENGTIIVRMDVPVAEQSAVLEKIEDHSIAAFGISNHLKDLQTLAAVTKVSVGAWRDKGAAPEVAVEAKPS